MKACIQLACCLGAAGVTLAATPAAAQNCTPAASTEAKPTVRQIQNLADQGYMALQEELTGAAARRAAARQRRETQFREVAQLHWRWTCEYLQPLMSRPPERATAIVQGVVFFDLAEDTANMRAWYNVGKAYVENLQADGITMPLYRGLPLGDLLRRAQMRLIPGQRTAPPRYEFCVDCRRMSAAAAGPASGSTAAAAPMTASASER